ncbi:FG-GAP repeat domain-containing protein [Tautonia plasticadhaerens]|uniref:FG-GAP repeat protein n=1 Tax=Tautonia plasticadhaerens TaxID=2527974 RepID=A0A518H5H8_9BACT|nr:VCBS repeat-containing protein [Tautonia plasticadhaerens]QDV36068.1 hypothetical protein ElP_39780 [Tautonia plasticadhaerens]
MTMATRRPGRSRAAGKGPDRAARPSAEALETRTLLAADTGLVRFDTFEEGDADWPAEVSGAPRVPTARMMVTQARGGLESPGDRDAVAVSLRAGEVFIASLDDFFTNDSRTGTYGLVLRGPDGSVLADESFEVTHSPFRTTVFDPGGPASSSFQGDRRLEFEVPTTGTYFVELADRSDLGSPEQSYTVGLRTIGLESGTLDRLFLNIGASNEIVARLAGDRLLLAGPVGIGFALRGAWSSTVEDAGEGRSRLRFEAGGTLQLESAIGDLPLPIPPGLTFTVTTSPGDDGSPRFGAVETIEFNADLGPFALARPLQDALGVSLGTPAGSLSLDREAYGLKLGRDGLVQETGAPVNANVPYLFYTYQSGLSAEFGGFEARTLGGYEWSIVTDPSDVFLYAGVSGIPSPLGEFAVAGSVKGNIPFDPFSRPSEYNGSVFGNIYLRADVDLSKLVGAPVSINGDLVIDFDVDDDGRILGGIADAPSRFVSGGFDPAVLGSAATDAISDVAIGANAEIRVGLEIGDAESGGGGDSSGLVALTVPIGEGTIVYDPAEEGIFARGGSVNPFEGTFLEAFGSNDRVLADGFIKRDGTFRLTYETNYRVLGYRLSGGTITVSNAGVTARGDVGLLGARAVVTGDIERNGDFEFRGRVEVDLGILAGNADVRFARIGSGVSFTAGFSARANTEIAGVEFGGSVSFSLSVGLSRGQLTYDGSARGSLFLGEFRIDAGLRIFADRNEFGFEIDIPGAAVIEDVVGGFLEFFGVERPDIPDTIRVSFPRGQASDESVMVPPPLPPPPPPPERPRTPGDFDGDGVTEFGAFGFSPVEGFARFAVLTSAGGLLNQPFGGPEDLPIAGDYDGDGVADLGVYGFSPAEGVSRFAVLASGGEVISRPFGGPDDLPVAGDFDGDDITDIAVYGFSPTEGFARFAIILSGGPSDTHPDGFISQPFGGPEDIPIAGDFDGDGTTDIGVYGFSPDEGFARFAVILSGGASKAYPEGFISRPFGGPGDLPIAGDFDGDGTTDIGVYGFSPAEGFARFAILLSGGASDAHPDGFISRPFGGPDDLPVSGDFDGDGTSDLGVYGFSPAEGVSRFAILPSGEGPAISQPFGGERDVALTIPPASVRFRRDGFASAPQASGTARAASRAGGVVPEGPARTPRSMIGRSGTAPLGGRGRPPSIPARGPASPGSRPLDLDRVRPRDRPDTPASWPDRLVESLGVRRRGLVPRPT